MENSLWPSILGDVDRDPPVWIRDPNNDPEWLQESEVHDAAAREGAVTLLCQLLHRLQDQFGSTPRMGGPEPPGQLTGQEPNTSSNVEADEGMIAQLVSMGVPQDNARKALIETGNTTVDEAMMQVVANMEKDSAPTYCECHVEIKSFSRRGLRLAVGVWLTQPKPENLTTISTNEHTGPMSNH